MPGAKNKSTTTQPTRFFYGKGAKPAPKKLSVVTPTPNPATGDAAIAKQAAPGRKINAAPAPKPKLPPPPPQKSDKNLKKVGKTLGNFQCTNEDCRKTWSSVHAWSSERFVCEGCGGKAKITKFADGECKLDTYNCSKCSESWQEVHDGATTKEMECYCGRMVKKNAQPQIRRGRHFYYQCLNKKGKCGNKWEDFSGGRKYSQRCRKCHSPGEMHSIKTVEVEVGPDGEKSIPGRGGGFIGGVGGGGHDVEGCDMCQILRGQGISGTCTRKNLVIFNVKIDRDGNATERVVGTR